MKIKVQHWFGRLISVFDDDVSFFAASLSFYSVLSVIPMLWVMFFILNQLGMFGEYFELVKLFLVDSLIPSDAEMVTNYLQGFMKNSDRMGSVGLLYIIITSVLFYRNYQYVVNKIFLVPNHSLWHSLLTYLLLAFLMPLTLGLSFYLSDYLQRLTGEVHGGLGSFALLSYFMIWALFFLLFKVSPNMHIHSRIALKVSFAASLIWHVAKWLFVQYTLMSQTFSTLYGSFSALLYLLVWVYLSWLLLLHGLRVCYLLHCHYGRYS